MTWLTRGATALVFGGVGFAALNAQAELPYPESTTPGELRGIAATETTAWPMSYWEYLPAAYATNPSEHRYPLLIVLGGIGSFDDVSVCPNSTPTCSPSACTESDGLCRAYLRGPTVLVRREEWDDIRFPVIFAAPQNPAPTGSAAEYDMDQVHAFMTYMLDTYPIDPSRIYLLGNSQGGRAAMEYVMAHPGLVTAFSVAPGGTVSAADAGCAFEDTAWWAFHGEDDDNGLLGTNVFSPCGMVGQVQMYNVPNSFPDFAHCVARVGTTYPEGRITVFEDVGHESWFPAFESSEATGVSAWTNDECGLGTTPHSYGFALDPGGVYEWLFGFDRPQIALPSEVHVDAEVGAVTLEPQITDLDAIVDTSWVEIEGPSTASMSAVGATIQLRDLIRGTYTFSLRVTDEDHQSNEVTIDVVVADAAGESGDGNDSSESTGPVDQPDTGCCDSDGGDSTGFDDGGMGEGTQSDFADNGDSSAGSADDGGGCSMRTGPDTAPRWSSLFALLGLGLIRRRRSRTSR